MLTASELLAAWERGIDRVAFERALVLLEASTGQPWDGLAALSIGQRNAKLLEVREAIFGSSLPCLIACPHCAEQLELNLDTADLRVSADGSIEQHDEVYALESEGIRLEFRLPNSFDLATASHAQDTENARALLIERCLLAAHDQEKTVSYHSLPQPVLAALTDAMAKADPQSHLELALTCPACEQAWQALFDIATYLWSEIETWALRILHEVHKLASAYGWREADILALSPLRRQLYLDRIGV